MSTKAFFYVLNRKDFDFFKKRSLNVVLLKKWNPQDGSLAFVAMKMKMPYITIECTEDDDKMMRILMDAVIDLVKYRNREWGK
jgi:hypothetical protein